MLGIGPRFTWISWSVAAALARARSAGAILEGAVRTYEWGRIAVMADPFGHGFCLIEFLGRGYDEIASQHQGMEDTGDASTSA